MLNRVWACLSLCALSACGSSGGLGKPVAEFPSKEKLEEVAAKPAKPMARLNTATVEQWQIQTPVPASGSSYPRETTWDALVLDAAARSQSVVPSAALRCAAQEAARFYVEHGAYPDDSLRAFLVGRCGSTLPTGDIQVVFSTAPDGTSDAELEASLKKSGDELISQRVAAGGELGVALARGNGRATLVAIAGKPTLRLRGFSPIVSGPSLTLEGDAPSDVGFVSGYVTQGDYGVKLCEPDRRLKLPAFRLECPVAEQDPEVRVDLVTGKPNQFFWRVGARLFARRESGGALAYRPRGAGSAENPADFQKFRQAFLAGLNEARRAAGVSALMLEPEQSHTNERLAPHFFQDADSEWMMEEVGLGLLAGWDVNGMIRGGSLYSTMSASSRSPSHFLSDALDSPFGRWMLLEPQMSRIAIGNAALEPAGVMALITTYALFDSQDHRADEASVFEELGKLRQARGLPAIRRVASDPALRSALGLVASNARPSDAALQEAMQRIATERNCSVSGYALETSDLSHLSFSDELLSAEASEVEIGVTHYKARGGAWGQYAILFVSLHGAATRTALATPARTKSALAAPTRKRRAPAGL